MKSSRWGIVPAIMGLCVYSVAGLMTVVTVAIMPSDVFTPGVVLTPLALLVGAWLLALPVPRSTRSWTILGLFLSPLIAGLLLLGFLSFFANDKQAVIFGLPFMGSAWWITYRACLSRSQVKPAKSIE